MKLALVTDDAALIDAAHEAFPEKGMVQVFSHWQPALEQAAGLDFLVVDMLSTLEEPGKIAGYERFAHAKMEHELASGLPLIVIQVPEGYELDGMAGWPNFLFAMVRRPVTVRNFKQMALWV